MLFYGTHICSVRAASFPDGTHTCSARSLTSRRNSHMQCAQPHFQTELTHAVRAASLPDGTHTCSARSVTSRRNSHMHCARSLTSRRNSHIQCACSLTSRRNSHMQCAQPHFQTMSRSIDTEFSEIEYTVSSCCDHFLHTQVLHGIVSANMKHECPVATSRDPYEQDTVLS
jgi:hypothetical protein